MIIGLAGPLCSGKNLAARYISEVCDVLHVDVDSYGHQALDMKQNEVVQEFGKHILDTGGKSGNSAINRKLLGNIVFSNRLRMRKLEAIVHPAMVDLVRKDIETSKHKHVLINAAILYQMGLQEDCDIIVLVLSPLLFRLLRCLSRDKLPVSQTFHRILSQKGLLKPYRKLKDKVCRIYNFGDKYKLYSKLDNILTTFGLVES